MLIVFAFSITPTIFFHNWLATHTDAIRKFTADNNDHVAKRTFNCHCNSIVAESPFTEPVYTIPLPALEIFSLQKEEKIVHIPCAATIFHSLRGPPVV